MPNDDLDDKKKIVLNQIIDSYLIDGAPVGSKTLSNKSEEMASSSSLRNIMSQLEVMGLIYSPHVSSGRLPTEKGLRLYVDNLLAFQTIYNENDKLFLKIYTMPVKEVQKNYYLKQVPLYLVCQAMLG